MVGQCAKATAIENHRAPHGFLGTLQFTNNLTHAYLGILFAQHIGKVHLNGFEKMDQRPGSTASLEKDVIDLIPGGFHLLFRGGGGGLGGHCIPCQIRV